MKNHFSQLNKAFENRIRLGIMSMLMVNDQVDFNTFKETLELTDGNLASHLSSLEKIGYVGAVKKFIGKKPNTSYSATKVGVQAFKAHIDALEKILKENKL